MKRASKIAAFLCCVLLLAAARLNSDAALKLDVSPSISRAPAAVKVRVTVVPAPGDRALNVVAESDNYYRSSEVQLEGRDSGAINVFEFRDLPTGLYQITGVVMTAQGPRATALRIIKVEPGLGGR